MSCNVLFGRFICQGSPELGDSLPFYRTRVRGEDLLLETPALRTTNANHT